MKNLYGYLSFLSLYLISVPADSIALSKEVEEAARCVRPFIARALDPLTRPIQQIAEKRRLVNFAEDVLKRDFTPKQKKLFLRAANITLSSQEDNAILQLQKSERSLVKKGFTKEEVSLLRSQDLLPGKEIDSILHHLPVAGELQVTRVKPTIIELEEFSKTVMSDLKKGGVKLTYIRDTKNQIFVHRGKIKYELSEGGPPWLIRANTTSPNIPDHFVALEIGTLKFDTKTQKPFLRPDKLIDMDAVEKEELLTQLEQKNPGITFKRTAHPANKEARILNCSDILASQLKGDTFLFDRVLGADLGLMTIIAIAEARGEGRIQTPAGREFIEAQLVGKTTTEVLEGMLGQYLTFSGTNLATALSSRVALGLIGSYGVQDAVNRTLLKENAEKRSAKQRDINLAWLGLRLLPKHYFDEIVIKNLPLLFYEKCRRGDKLRVFVGPRSLRITEQLTWALIYLDFNKRLSAE